MTITLPRLPRGAQYALRHIRNSQVQRSGTGGSVTGLNRPGDHWAVEVDPGVLGTACGRALLADIVRGSGERLRVPLPQPGVDVGPIGAPRVKGAGQSGSTLLMDGLTPGIIVRKGYFFTLETTDGPTAHIVTALAVADDEGEATVTFWPMMWLEPADSDVIEMAEPYIEGLIVDDGDQTSGVFAAVTTSPFVIEEGA